MPTANANLTSLNRNVASAMVRSVLRLLTIFATSEPFERLQPVLLMYKSLVKGTILGTKRMSDFNPSKGLRTQSDVTQRAAAQCS